MTKDINSNRSTTVLTRQLGDPNARIIITTIQKLSTFIKKNKEHEVYDKHRALKYALLYATIFNKYTLNSRLYGKRVNSACKSLLNQFGMPDMDKLKKEIDPLSERYDRTFEFRHIERTIKRILN